LEEINLQVSGLEQPVQFTWFAEVSLTLGAQGWLGWLNETEAMPIEANDQSLKTTIMFSQDSIPHVTWSTFVQWVEGSQENQLDLDVKLCFLRFEKKLKIRVSIELLKILFDKGREKYGSAQPYRAHVKAIV